MKTPLFALATLALVLVPAGADAETLLASHRILVGDLDFGFSTVFGCAGNVCVDGYEVAAPAAGTILRTATTDNSGTGYDVDIVFWTEDFSDTVAPGSCDTVAPDEECPVPEGAAWVDVVAYLGVDLTVALYATPPAP